MRRLGLDARETTQPFTEFLDHIHPDDRDLVSTAFAESLRDGRARARIDRIAFLSDDEKRVLNQIRGHEYLSLFGLVEEFILPFVLDHARPQLDGDDHRVRALLNFASEEAKHIHLFREFHRRFTDGFGSECAVIGPPQAIADKVRVKLRPAPVQTAERIRRAIEVFVQHLEHSEGRPTVPPGVRRPTQQELATEKIKRNQGLGEDEPATEEPADEPNTP